MGYSSALISTNFPLLFLFVVLVNLTNGKPLVPALFIFGDSSLDVGNNNNEPTIAKANFPPYGRDFGNHIPTGRFCNGKLTVDYAAEAFGFTSYQPPYLSLLIKGNNILNGANFASSGSGYLDSTANLYHAIPMSKQLEYYMKYQKELIKIAGKSNALYIISSGIYVVGAGSGDFVLNYYINPLLQKAYTPYQFSDILVQQYSNFIQSLYAIGARKIGVPTLTAIGCFPIAITLFGFHSNNKCVVNLNNVAIYFNQKLNSTSHHLRKLLPQLDLILLDAYGPLYDMANKPLEYGFFEARKACCGTGLLETSIFCNPMSIGTCVDASKYVFWDSVHPTGAANKVLAANLVSEILPIIYR